MGGRFDKIIDCLVNLKKHNSLIDSDKVVFDALFDSILKEKLVIKKLKKKPISSISSSIKILYTFRDLKLKDAATTYLKLILPKTKEDALTLVKDISLFLSTSHSNEVSTFELIFIFFEQKAIEQKKIRTEQIFDIWENKTSKSKICKDSAKTKSDSKKKKTTKAKKKSSNSFKNPYARFISVPFGGLNKRY